MPLNTIPNKGLTSRGYPSDRLVTPIIINGDMSVAQRATSVTSKTSGGYYTVDRMEMAINFGTWSISQSTDTPSGEGFSNSFKLDCTATGTPTAGQELKFRQKIEGQNLQMLKKGTSNAEYMTLAFWVKSTKTGTYIIEMRDDDNNRNICGAYTINASNTWEKKILSFAGDTTGAYSNDNGQSLQCTFWLGAGSNFTSGTLATSWESTTNANRAVGQVNLADSTANEWYITGVQLEVGEFDSTTIPSFPFESFESNFRKCARYFLQLGYSTYGDDPPGGGRLATGIRDGSSSATFYPTLPVLTPLRATPSLLFNSVNVRQDGTNISLSSTNTIRQYVGFVGFNAVAASNLSVSNAAQLRFTGSGGYVRIDAEL